MKSNYFLRKYEVVKGKIGDEEARGIREAKESFIDDKVYWQFFQVNSTPMYRLSEINSWFFKSAYWERLGKFVLSGSYRISVRRVNLILSEIYK